MYDATGKILKTLGSLAVVKCIGRSRREQNNIINTFIMSLISHL